MPQGYKRTHEDDKKFYYVRKENGRFTWDIHADKAERFASFSAYHKKVRKDLYYIYGNSKLWYIKRFAQQFTYIKKKFFNTYFCSYALDERIGTLQSTEI